MPQEYSEEIKKVMEQIDKDKGWFRDNYDSLRKKYPNSRYLVILNREVLEHDSDTISLDRKMSKRNLGFYYEADFEEPQRNDPEPAGFSWSFRV